MNILGILLVIASVVAEEIRLCGTRSYKQTTDYEHELMVASVLDALVFPESIRVPIAFHVFTDAVGTGNVSVETIEQQVEILNSDYAVANISFQLQTINYAVNEKFAAVGQYSAQELNMKNAYRQGGADTLNVYLTRLSNGLLGWSSFSQDYSGNPMNDGIVLSSNTLPGSSSKTFNMGRTLVHETGHWLGLYHTFEGGCSFDNDFVLDTRAEASPKFGCLPATSKIRTCEKANFEEVELEKYSEMDQLAPVDPFSNFMNYQNDKCMTSWTSGQIDRMKAQWLFRSK